MLYKSRDDDKVWWSQQGRRDRPDLFDDKFSQQRTSHRSAIVENSMRRTVRYQQIGFVRNQDPVLPELWEWQRKSAGRRLALPRPRSSVNAESFDEDRLVLEVNGVFQARPHTVDCLPNKAHLVVAGHVYLQQNKPIQFSRRRHARLKSGIDFLNRNQLLGHILHDFCLQFLMSTVNSNLCTSYSEVNFRKSCD